MKTAPYRMSRGSATTDSEFAYLTPGCSKLVYRYKLSTAEWEKFPPSPSYNSGLVIIDGELTAVGGWGGSRPTNQLFTLQKGQWVELYPPMNTARSDSAVVSTSDNNYIFVIGGVGGNTVEMFHVRTRKWYELTNLPEALTRPSATICGNQLYVIGEHGVGFSCSLPAMLSRDQLSWTLLPRQPVEYSTVATLYGQLVIVGGRQSWTEVNSIHQLIHGQWVEIGSMSSGRRESLVISPSPSKIMIVGGKRGNSTTDIVEECVVV